MIKTTLQPPSGFPNTVENQSPLLCRFSEIVDKYGDIPACLWEGHSLSYSELDQISSDLAVRILAMSGDSPRPVAVFLDRTCEVLLACLAAAKAGIAYVPLNMTWPQKRTEQVLDRIDARLGLVSQRQAWPVDPANRMAVIEIDARNRPEQWRQHIPEPMNHTTPLYVLFTSGSTGTPKGVVVTHGNVTQFATSPECPGFEPGKRVTTCCATAFDLSVAEIWGGMLNGCTMVCSPPNTFLDSRRCQEFLRTFKMDYAVLPTAVFNALASQDTEIFGSLKKLILCGELPNSALCKKVMQSAPPEAFYNTYGPTECTVFVTAEKLAEVDDTAIIPAGTPIPTASIQIVDEKAASLPPGQWGEVIIGGQGVAAGYYNDPERTNKAFIPDPAGSGTVVYRTGDRGMLDAKGRLTVSGRFDDQIKISGMRFELGEIRTLLNSAPHVRGGYAVYNSEHGIIAYVVAEKNLSFISEEHTRAQVQTHLEKYLPQPMLPRHIILLPALPLNTNGKIDAAQLPLPTCSQPSAAPEEDTSEILECFRAALLNDEFTAEDSFLACGGNSLVAAILIGTLHRQTGVWVPLEYFSKPKTAQLVQMFISSAKPVSAAPIQQQIREQVRF